MLDDLTHSPDSLEIDNLRTAADILRYWPSELRTLAIDNARLSYSFAASDGLHRHLLDRLTGTIELLAVARDSEQAQPLRQRARTLTTQLVVEVDILASVADRDFEWDR